MLIHVAEDDTGVRELMIAFLEGEGHTVKAAMNGVELVKNALEERPDLVITDLHMPEMMGNSMIAMLDMYPGLGGIPVIIVSGATPMEISDMGIPKEIPILGKPLDFAKFSAVLARYQK